MLLCACSEGPRQVGRGRRVRVDGSSTVYPLSEAVAEDFREVAPEVRVAVAHSGTGGGFKRFVVGDIDVATASRPIKVSERDAAARAGVAFVELPVAFDGLTIVVHRDNHWVDHLTVAELQRIFLEGPAAGAESWDDVRADFPPLPLSIFSPGTDSGTFDRLKEVIAAGGESIRRDIQFSEDDHFLVTGVAGEPGAIGLFGCSYYFSNGGRVRAVPIDAGQGPVLPTRASIADGSYQPFSRPLFLYVSDRSLREPQVVEFVHYFLSRAPELADELGYVPLSPELYARARARFDAGERGTHFLTDEGRRREGTLVELYR